MNLSSAARYVVTLALATGATTILLGTGSAAASSSGCERVTGHLDDHGKTVIAVFHVPVTCQKVSVLTWYAPGPHGEEPQTLLDYKGRDDVAPGDYEWTLAAPPRKCFRQLDLRVPGRNVDSSVGGKQLCSSSTPPTTARPRPAPTTTTTSTTAPAAVLPFVARPAPAALPTTTTTTPAAVLPAVITRPAPSVELPNTGGRVGGETALALVGIGLGVGTLAVRRWHRKRLLETAGFSR